MHRLQAGRPPGGYDVSFLGMGSGEIILVLIVAFIFLGPERMIDAARLLAKGVKEGRNLAAQIPRVVVEDDDIKLVTAGETLSVTGQPSTNPGRSTSPQTDRAADGDEGPVPFSRRSEPDPHPDDPERAVSDRPL